MNKKEKNIIPKSIFFTWDIQYQCNYNCSYCFLHFEKNTAQVKPVYLAPLEWMRIWKGIHKLYGESQIQITGGEPFAYPDFMDLICELSKIHTISLSTNLSCDVDLLISKVKPERIKIDSAYHPEFAKIDQFLDKVLKLKKNNYLISVTLVAYPALLGKAKEFGRIFKEQGIDLIIYPYRGPYQGRYFPKGYNQDELSILRELGLHLGANVSKRLEEKQMAVKNMIMPDNPEPKETASDQNKSKKICRMGQRYAKIIPNADVYRCCAAVWDETKPWASWGGLGNLIKQTFKLIDQPAECNYWENCSCYKSMVLGEEERWIKEWNNLNQIRKNLEAKENLERVKALRDQGNINQAIDKLQKILKEESGDMQALTLLAECFTIQGHFTKAEKILKSSLENNLDGDNLSWMYRTLAKVYNRLALLAIGNDKEMKAKCSLSLDYLSKAIKDAIKSNNLIDQSEGYYETAEIFYILKDFDKALENMDLAIKVNPKKEFLHRKKEEWSIESKRQG